MHRSACYDVSGGRPYDTWAASSRGLGHRRRGIKSSQSTTKVKSVIRGVTGPDARHVSTPLLRMEGVPVR